MSSVVLAAYPAASTPRCANVSLAIGASTRTATASGMSWTGFLHPTVIAGMSREVWLLSGNECDDIARSLAASTSEGAVAASVALCELSAVGF